MDEKHFDESLKEIMENPPEFEVDRQALVDMERRLDEAERRKRSAVGWPWWIAPLMALPFLIASIFFYLKLQNTQNQGNGETLHLTQQIDTIIQKHITYHFDTIYTKVYQKIILEPAYISSGDSQFSNFSMVYPSFYQQGSQNNAEKQFPDWRRGKGASLNSEIEEEEEIDWSKLASIRELSLKPLLVPRKYYWNKGIEDDWPKPDSAQIERKVNPVYYFIPTGFRIGLHGSPLNFINLPGGGGINGFGYGLAGEVQFGKSVRMRLGAELLRVSFELKNETEFSAFPQIDPESPNDVLKELYGDIDYVQIPLSFQYHFRSEKAFRPYVDLGFIARRSTKQSFKYEFIGSGGEYKSNQTFANSSFSINNLRTALGFEYQLWKNVYGNVEGFYHYNLEQPEDEYLELRYWGLDLGLKYGF